MGSKLLSTSTAELSAAGEWRPPSILPDLSTAALNRIASEAAGHNVADAKALRCKPVRNPEQLLRPLAAGPASTMSAEQAYSLLLAILGEEAVAALGPLPSPSSLAPPVSTRMPQQGRDLPAPDAPAVSALGVSGGGGDDSDDDEHLWAVVDDLVSSRLAARTLPLATPAPRSALTRSLSGGIDDDDDDDLLWEAADRAVAAVQEAKQRATGRAAGGLQLVSALDRLRSESGQVLSSGACLLQPQPAEGGRGTSVMGMGHLQSQLPSENGNATATVHPRRQERSEFDSMLREMGLVEECHPPSAPVLAYYGQRQAGAAIEQAQALRHQQPRHSSEKTPWQRQQSCCNGEGDEEGAVVIVVDDDGQDWDHRSCGPGLLPAPMEMQSGGPQDFSLSSRGGMALMHVPGAFNAWAQPDPEEEALVIVEDDEAYEDEAAGPSRQCPSLHLGVPPSALTEKAKGEEEEPSVAVMDCSGDDACAADEKRGSQDSFDWDAGCAVLSQPSEDEAAMMMELEIDAETEVQGGRPAQGDEEPRPRLALLKRRGDTTSGGLLRARIAEVRVGTAEEDRLSF